MKKRTKFRGVNEKVSFTEVLENEFTNGIELFSFRNDESCVIHEEKPDTTNPLYILGLVTLSAPFDLISLEKSFGDNDLVYHGHDHKVFMFGQLEKSRWASLSVEAGTKTQLETILIGSPFYNSEASKIPGYQLNVWLEVIRG